MQAKTEDQLASEKAWLSAERVWLVHKGGFAAARVLKPGTDGSFTEGKCKVKLEHGGEVLEVDEDDVEKVHFHLLYRFELIVLKIILV